MRAMYRLGFIIVFLVFSGCSSIDDAAVDVRDRYSRAAYSWQGASIVEMIKAWGHPSRRFQLPEGEDAGIAWWDHRAEEPSSTGGYMYVRYHCSTVVHFDSNLKITQIEVRHSRNCQRRYHGFFESMTNGLKA